MLNKRIDLTLSRLLTEIMRGVSILLIMLHNLLHVYPGVLNESEFCFDMHVINRFQHILKSGSSLFAYDMVSFLGWYGVPVFIFLSGYGLTRRYDKSLCGGADSMTLLSDDRNHFNALQFLKRNWIKLFTLMLLGVMIFSIDNLITIISSETHTGWKLFIGILIPLTCLNDLVEFRWHTIPGVYWYFGLAFELYVIYAYCIHGRKEKRMWILTFLCFLAIGAVWYLFPKEPADKWIEFLRSNFVGWMPPFACGVWLARHPRQPLWGVILTIVFSLCLFIPALNNIWSWQLTSVIAVIIILAISIVFSKIPYFNKFWIWTGKLSAYLFVCHPIVRHFVRFQTFSAPHPHPEFLHCLLYVIGVFLCALLYRFITGKLRSIISRLNFRRSGSRNHPHLLK